MPIFEYRCPECGQITEKIQSKPHPHINCPACSTPAMRSVSRTAVTVAAGSCSTGAGSGFT
ncbi:MAG: FmdB family zinc ribbon protein [Pelovirga sp.]